VRLAAGGWKNAASFFGGRRLFWAAADDFRGSAAQGRFAGLPVAGFRRHVRMVGGNAGAGREKGPASRQMRRPFFAAGGIFP